MREREILFWICSCISRGSRLKFISETASGYFDLPAKLKYRGGD
jgi:hypothetical protein